jgi:hypothetical protein
MNESKENVREKGKSQTSQTKRTTTTTRTLLATIIINLTIGIVKSTFSMSHQNNAMGMIRNG